eukprot:gene9339-10324_t
MDMNTKKVLAAIVLLFSIINFTSSAPVQAQLESAVTADAMDFLENYGYVQRPNTKLGKLLSEKDVTEGIKAMQRFAGFPVTGVLDAATKKLMNSTRCGMPDLGRADSARRKRRYSHQGSQWNKEKLTWRIHNYGNDNLKRDLVRATIMNSLKKWSDVTNLSFKEISTGEPDIWFKFVRGAHGDPYPFRLPYSSVLAHAFYPMDGKMPLAGDVHYNDDKQYTIATGKGVDLLWVTVHELGHSIGLDHSNVHGAIMYPYYQDNGGKDFDLTPDDIKGIQTLYGSRAKPTVKIPDQKTIKPAKPYDPKCFSKVGGVFLGNDKKTYIFNNDKLFILKKGLGIEKGPIPVSKLFKGVDKVDAAFKRQSDKHTILFSGKNYFVFDGSHNYVSGPTPISQGFRGFSSDFGDIDAAFVWPGNKLLYIFKGDKYWRVYLINGQYKVASSYPRTISSAWKGVPNDITAVFPWRNGVTYFFKGSKYYRLTHDLKVQKGYPRETTKAWAQLSYCQKSGAVVDSKRSAASKSAIHVVVATMTMLLGSLLMLA